MEQVTIVDGTTPLRLRDVDPDGTGGISEEHASKALERLSDELLELQELMYAAESHAILVILQGMDAAGKDVTIRHVFQSANPESIRVKHFSQMTEVEALHDFLWRAHAQTPARGEIVIFDRSYYEQVVMPQVEGEADDDDVAGGFEDVRSFERLLARAGTVVVKFFLHVSNEEQKRRLADRMANDETAWKISARDWTARRQWDDYMAAYERTMTETGTAELPWYVVPADHQWFHNLAVAEVLVERLRPHREAWIEARNERGAEERAKAEKEAPDDVKG